MRVLLTSCIVRAIFFTWLFSRTDGVPEVHCHSGCWDCTACTEVYPADTVPERCIDSNPMYPELQDYVQSQIPDCRNLHVTESYFDM
jgi:hypothetical protein